jgi:hypothetical protein
MGGRQIAGPEGGGGGGGVSGITTVTSTDGSITVTNPGGPTTNLKANGTFGEDTVLQKNNAAATLKNILELIAAYTNNATGVEASKWTIKVLQAGAQVAAQVIAGLGTLFPAGTFDGTPADTVCGVAVGSVDFGMNKYIAGGQLAFSVNGRESFFLTKTSGSDGNLEIDGTFANITLGGDAGIARSVDATSSQSNLSLLGKFGSVVTDVVVGPNAALGNTDNGGFLQLPSMPGIPSGVPLLNTGKRAIAVVQTALQEQLAVCNSAGAWKVLSAIMKFSGTIFGGAGAVSSFLTDSGTALAANAADPQYTLTGIGNRIWYNLGVTVIANSTMTQAVIVTLFSGITNTGLTVSIPAGSAAGTFRADTAHFPVIAANAAFSIKMGAAAADVGHSLSVSVTVEYSL